MMKDPMGDRMKVYENAFSYRLSKHLPIYARLDGRCFSKWTKRFDSPFSSAMLGAMLGAMSSTCEYLLRETHATVAYAQSDEISLIWEPCLREEQDVIFGGKIQKMCSVFAGLATARFMNSFVQDEEATKFPVFDCRVLNIPNEWETVNMLRWRYFDASRNAINAVARQEFGHRALDGVSTKDKLRMIIDSENVDWDEIPAQFKNGILMWRDGRTVVKEDNCNEIFLDNDRLFSLIFPDGS